MPNDRTVIETQNDKRKTQNEISVNLPKNASFRATGVYGGSREIYVLSAFYWFVGA